MYSIPKQDIYSNNINVERKSNKSNATFTLPEVAELSINVVLLTKEDDRIHNYQISSTDCFAHLEVQSGCMVSLQRLKATLARLTSQISRFQQNEVLQ